MVTVRLRTLSALVVVSAAFLLAACGNATVQPGSGSTDQPTAGARSSVPSGAPTTAPTTAPSANPMPVPSASGGGGTFRPGPTGIPVGSPKAITIDGIIEAGVEPGCKVLTAGNTKYLILGGGDVQMGVPVRVEGTLQPGVLSTCQQGTPLRATSVKRR
jgi:predicted small secreted protein